MQLKSGLAVWTKALIDRFKVTESQALEELLAERYTLDNIHSKRDPMAYVQAVVRHAKAANMDTHNQLLFAWRNLDTSSSNTRRSGTSITLALHRQPSDKTPIIPLDNPMDPISKPPASPSTPAAIQTPSATRIVVLDRLHKLDFAHEHHPDPTISHTVTRATVEALDIPRIDLEHLLVDALAHSLPGPTRTGGMMRRTYPVPQLSNTVPQVAYRPPQLIEAHFGETKGFTQPEPYNYQDYDYSTYLGDPNEYSDEVDVNFNDTF
ncbi:MAG: hypothetical protein M1812_007867 [Candelaria pacifica]|nr:MAG: hypothetical protein M1812_007867 [Candelaria pacifica]